VIREIEEIIGLDCSNIIHASAKTGIGIEDTLEAIVKQVPPPKNTVTVSNSQLRSACGLAAPDACGPCRTRRRRCMPVRSIVADVVTSAFRTCTQLRTCKKLRTGTQLRGRCQSLS
jgi:hypothetical protein